MREAKSVARPRGRPPKFREERRPVTMTLPDRILRRLAEVDTDRSRAVVKVTEAALESTDRDRNPVSLVQIEPGQSLIVVSGSTASLRGIPWLKLVEIAPARHLLSLPIGTTLEQLELAIIDLIDSDAESQEDCLLLQLRKLITQLRLENRMSKWEIIFVADDRT